MRTTLRFFQHAWSATGLDPDGCCYATKAEADDAEVATARSRIADCGDDEICEALTMHVKADDVSDARLQAIRDGAELEDAEAMMAAEELDGYVSAVYAIDVQIDTLDLLTALRAKGYAVSVWTPEDFATPADLERLREPLEDILGQRGNDFISDMGAAPGEEGEDEDEDEDEDEVESTGPILAKALECLLGHAPEGAEVRPEARERLLIRLLNGQEPESAAEDVNAEMLAFILP